MTGDSPTDIDLARVLADIDEEVRLRKASGDLPPTLDRELDDLFETLTPSDRRSDDFAVAVDRAEEAAFIDVDVPTSSRIPGGQAAKWLLAKLIRWFASHLAQQTTVFATAASRGLRLLGQRVDLLEARVQALEHEPAADLARLAAEPRPPAPGPDLSRWVDVVADLLAGRPGRVAHAECGSGSLLALLVERGYDAYGVEPAEHNLTAAVGQGLEVRLDDGARHLGNLPGAALTGLVLSGCVERLPPAELLELADQAARVVAPGGLLALISASPEAWGRLNPVEADLAPGRPFHAQTWDTLLRARGFTDVAIAGGEVGGAAGDGRYALTAVRTDASPPAAR